MAGIDIADFWNKDIVQHTNTATKMTESRNNFQTDQCLRSGCNHDSNNVHLFRVVMLKPDRAWIWLPENHWDCF